MAKKIDPSRNGHARPSSAKGVNRLAGIPLNPSVTVKEEAPTEGRDASSGRFTARNRFGRGNPFARKMASLRKAFLSVATEERMRALGEKLYAAAVEGDLTATKLFLLVTLGRPAAAVNPDALDKEEWQQAQEWPHMADVYAMFGKVMFADALSRRQVMDNTVLPLAQTGERERNA